MNNIIIENDEISFDNEKINLETRAENLIININGNVTINELKVNNITKNLTININKNSTLIYNKFNSNAHCNLNVVININSYANFYGNMAFIALNENNINIVTNMLGENIINILKIKGISKKKGFYKIKVDGNVLKNNINNKMKESIKILTQNNVENTILPNMLIATNEVQADHFATISSIDNNELFYLTSKGITKDKAIQLIEKGFILDTFEDQDIIKIINSQEVEYES